VPTAQALALRTAGHSDQELASDRKWLNYWVAIAHPISAKHDEEDDHPNIYHG